MMGCSSSSEPNRVVTGNVTVDGKPANAGEVVFQFEKRRVATAIEKDGSYKAMGVPLGTAKVTLASPNEDAVVGDVIDENTGESKKVDPITPVPIPEKYRSADTSGLTVTIADRETSFPIQLTSN